MPDADGNIFDGCNAGGAYAETVSQFCEKFCAAAEDWMLEHGELPVVMKNLENMMRVYPSGLPPYLVGVPVIA